MHMAINSLIGFELTVVIILSMQMIALYKDPKGENVFSDSATRDIDLGSSPAQQQRELQLSTEDTLRRRIRQLENLISTYTVCYYIIPHEY